MATSSDGTYTVEYSGERGGRNVRRFTDWQAARDAFLATTGDPDHGFPIPDEWPLIGYVTETWAQFGYVESLPYTSDRGHATVSIGFDVFHYGE